MKPVTCNIACYHSRLDDESVVLDAARRCAPRLQRQPCESLTTSTGFPDIRGTWTGLAQSMPALTTARPATTCAPNDGLSGHSRMHPCRFETGGAPCLQQAGYLEGTITTSGAIATFSINMTVGQGGPCVVVAQHALAGTFAARTVNVRFSDEITCSSGSNTFRSTMRTVSVELTRQ